MSQQDWQSQPQQPQQWQSQPQQQWQSQPQQPQQWQSQPQQQWPQQPQTGYPQPGYQQPGYPQAYQQPGQVAAYGQQKDWLVALLLCVFVGTLGIHRFYVGKVGTGIAMFFTGGGCLVWWIIDLISIANNSFRDANGLPLLKKQ